MSEEFSLLSSTTERTLNHMMSEEFSLLSSTIVRTVNHMVNKVFFLISRHNNENSES